MCIIFISNDTLKDFILQTQKEPRRIFGIFLHSKFIWNLHYFHQCFQSVKTKLSEAQPELPNGKEHCAMGSLVVRLSTTDTCEYVCKYVGQRGSTAMLTTVQLEGESEESTLAGKLGIHPGFETHDRDHHKPKISINDRTKNNLWIAPVLYYSYPGRRSVWASVIVISPLGTSL